jgi:hypothetical protein
MNREERVVRNEALAREVNDRVEEVHAGRKQPDDQVRMFCECGDADCTGVVAITLAEFERVRADPLHFAVIRDHVIPDLEDVVEDHQRYVVVRKKEGVAAEIARREDPRSGS